jgi:hypothetical protein
MRIREGKKQNESGTLPDSVSGGFEAFNKAEMQEYQEKAYF